MHYILVAVAFVVGLVLGAVSVILRVLGIETKGKRNIRAREVRRTVGYYRSRQENAYEGRHAAPKYRLQQSPTTGLFEYELAA